MSENSINEILIKIAAVHGDVLLLKKDISYLQNDVSNFESKYKDHDTRIRVLEDYKNVSIGKMAVVVLIALGLVTLIGQMVMKWIFP